MKVALFDQLMLLFGTKLIKTKSLLTDVVCRAIMLYNNFDFASKGVYIVT